MFSACAPFLAAYAATTYRVGRVGLRLGGRAEALLARHGARRAVVLTAWDPLSRLRGRAANRAAQARL
ncbi:hypothetical protein NON00_24630, partial [Roseomonas sp. GC11]|uniref:hypothetical protein n=1 Tax=Roseomonas sp. GC11 TaxID=2950546 RepID=UPI00210D6408